ncbi:hypothetical protein [Botryobacter ruber]|uniref:hypothetical protein n=1 Tax=Botryobacter ruber TaxID=2171629 RepID=UPI000E09FA2F|nr:hypothetical protein [Botryobacter ruber]
MAKERTIDFAVLQLGAELETPHGVGKFLAYKKGNFRAQNVLVEHVPYKLKWYTEKELEIANTMKKTSPAREASQQAFITDFFYYAL